MPSFVAVKVAAMVELTSPTTSTNAGFASKQTFSNSTITFAVCWHESQIQHQGNMRVQAFQGHEKKHPT
jgi:hypothetical protein